MFIVIYFFVFSFQKPYQPYSLWYKSSSSYIEVPVLTVVKGQVHMPSFIYRILSQALVEVIELSKYCTPFRVCFPVRLKQNCTVVLLTLDRFNAFTRRYMCYDLLSTY